MVIFVFENFAKLQKFFNTKIVKKYMKKSLKSRTMETFRSIHNIIVLQFANDWLIVDTYNVCLSSNDNRPLSIKRRISMALS